MTPYELLCDTKTKRLNENCYQHGNVLYYVGDQEMEHVRAELIVDMILLAQRKK